MSFHYLDSSVAVRIMLGHSGSAAQWFDSTTGQDGERVVSSRILRTEITRVLRSEGLPVADRDQILDYVDTIALDHAVLQEAEAIIPHVRTLDAIHLASALRSGLEDLVIVTHDATMKTVASAIGFRINDPVE
ncbi:type II toxin-antitoxin system VapC family toxin [Mycobacterium sp. Y57]|uniref:type II toxin-antitoxin system VapC family toxin n=1 Tax=Mycolicibacterium xanthum TaxID=2796469 RepID=UPI001C856DFF|nr:type II toxin-antitoxin system VapC family toxin [Mycolicibacterium xanthum]MBX7432562.1 type II toxin-antitoxin system VapC family toxin [Mycolicibacterium xanthum]